VNDVFENIAQAIGRLDPAENTKILLNSAVSQGVNASDIVEKGIRRGLEIVGQKYEAGEYFLSELLYAGSLVADLSEILKPALKNQRIQMRGVIALGTVKGDIHDIGKNVFRMLADSAGFEVHDLGVDVDPSVFVDEIERSGPQVLGLSALLTTTLPEMKNTIDSVRAAGVRDKLRILLGGNAVKKEFGSEIGADATALDAVEGLGICRRWTQK